MISEILVAIFSLVLAVEIYIAIDRMNKLHVECEKNITQVEEKFSAKLKSLVSEYFEKKSPGSACTVV